MKKLLLITYFLLAFAIFFLALPFALLFSAPVHAADASTCYTISDADARTYCLARAHKEPGMCYAVQRKDLRAACLAEVRK